jgi:hypothetical protein
MDQFILEDEDITLLRSVGEHLLREATSLPGRQESPKST